MYWIIDKEREVPKESKNELVHCTYEARGHAVPKWNERV